MGRQHKIKCVLVEGADNTGKDTFCSQFKSWVQNVTGRPVLYMCPKYEPMTDDYQRTQKQLKEWVENFVTTPDDTLLLLNRSWLDEYVYARMYRNYNDEDLAWTLEMTPGFISSTAYIWLWDVPETLYLREDGKSLSEGSVEKIVTEQDLFYDLYCHAEACGLDTLRAQSSKWPKDEYWKAAEGWLEKLKV